MKKYLLSLIAIAACSLGAIAQVTYSGGSGTEDDPYLMSSAEDLQTMAVQMNYGSVNDYDGVYFKMTGDISLANQYLPCIGLGNRQFKGVFDGDNHSITGMNYSSTGGTTIGIFGYIDAKGTLKNIIIESPVFVLKGNVVGFGFLASNVNGTVDNCHVKNATLTVDMSGSTAGTNQGGLVGSTGGTAVIKNSSFSGTVKAARYFGTIVNRNQGTLENCTSDAKITSISPANYASLARIGGLLSQSQGGTIKNCSFSGEIIGELQNVVGGIAAETSGNTLISFCSNSGKVVGNTAGGIVGYLNGNTSVISDCYNTGTVSDRFYERDSLVTGYGMNLFIGGIVGQTYNISSIERCFNTGTIKSMKNGAAITAQINSGTITNCYNAGLIYAPSSDKAGGIVGNTESIGLNLAVTNCLNYGTTYFGTIGIDGDCEIVGNASSKLVAENNWFDAITAGYGSGKPGALTTAQLTSGEAISGFDTDVWTFTAGMYPRLTATAATDAAKVGAVPFYLADGNLHTKVNKDFTLGTGATWTTAASQVEISGSNAAVTVGKEKEDAILTATLGDAGKDCLVTVYPKMFTGSGTEDDPYLITTLAHMEKLEGYANNQGMNFIGDYFKMGNDIDMENSSFAISSDPNNGFGGTFDGDGHTLTGYVIPTVTGMGLFAYIGATGTVKNLALEGSGVQSLSTNSAPFCYTLYGTLENCRNSINVTTTTNHIAGIVCEVKTGGQVIDCFNEGNVTCTSSNGSIAGIASNNNGVIDGCQNVGAITASQSYQMTNIGGIVANNAGMVRNCLSSGNVSGYKNVGGLIGIAMNQLCEAENCLVTAVVNYSRNVDYAGAVIGSGITTGTFRDVVYDKQISIYDNGYGEGVTGKTTEEIMAAAPQGDKWLLVEGRYPMLAKFADRPSAILYSIPVKFAAGDTRLNMTANQYATWPVTTGLTCSIEDRDDFTITAASGRFKFDGYSGYCYDTFKMSYTGSPVTRNFKIGAQGTPFSGAGTEANPWVIATPADLTKLYTQVNRSLLSYEGQYFSVTADIDMTNVANQKGIAQGDAYGNTTAFKGIIRGNGHKISGINISGTAYTGFIGYLGEGGKIEDLEVEGTVSATSMVAGGVAAQNAGALSNVTGRVNVTSTYNGTGTTANSIMGVGGIVGRSIGNAAYSNVANYGNVQSNSSFTGGVIGSLVGSNTTYGTLENHGDVNSTKTSTGGVAGCTFNVALTDVFNDGTVTATGAMTGGIVGWMVNGLSIVRAANEGAVNGTNSLGGVAGRFESPTATDMVNMTECYNYGNVTGSIYNIGGIVGQTNGNNGCYPILIERCANTGNVTNTAASVKSGNSGAGGIVGTGLPVIVDCLNSGTITAPDAVAQIVGLPYNATAAYSLTNVLATGSVEGYNANATLVGAIASRASSGATFTNVVYDKQLCNVAAVAKADANGISALLTREVVANDMGANWTSGNVATVMDLKSVALPGIADRYPQITALMNCPAVAVSSMPVFLADEDTRYNVTGNFNVSVEDGFAWLADENTFAIKNDGFVRVFKDIEVGESAKIEGDYDLIVTDGNYSHLYRLSVNCDYINTAISNVTAGKTAVAVQYVNAAGMVSGKPFPGMNIIVTTWDDGSRTVTKALK